MDSTQKVFTHKRLGLSLTLTHSADDLTQGDVERFLAAYNALPQGLTKPEDNGKTLRAALTAGWVVEPALTVADVENLKRKHARWYAEQIDAVYIEAGNIPNE